MISKTSRWQWKTTGIMAFILIIGILVLVLCRLYSSVLGEWKAVLDNLTMAFIVAGILGLSIDQLFRQQLAEDAFRASIGYLLPDELKGEMEWLYKCHILCVEHIQRFELVALDDDTCTVHVKEYRKLRNVSGSITKAELGVGIDEWFHKTGSSKIIGAGYIKEGVSWPDDGDTIKKYKHQWALV